MGKPLNCDEISFWKKIMNTLLQQKFDALALFSGGLDSILAARLVQEQGIRVLGLHFVSPFFGHPDRIKEWEENYSIPVIPVDISCEFGKMLCQGPRHGIGKVLNPCLDCKILMLNTAKAMLGDFSAGFIVSGEVLGQRPMSQRLDALNIIKRDADVKDILVRALSARHLPPTKPEYTGILDREKLGSISGRGRKMQMELARRFNINPLPTPAGGCLLTEKESAKRYLPLIRYKKEPEPEDFHLANTGRQLWNNKYWLCVGRDKRDNARLEALAKNQDYLFNLAYYPGPLGLGRPLNDKDWPVETIAGACEILSRFSPKARKSSRQVDIIVKHKDSEKEILVWPGQIEHSSMWQEPAWDRDLSRSIHHANNTADFQEELQSDGNAN